MNLTLENVGKSFGEKKILSSFSYSFPKCGLFIISGPSGRGKTTLLRIIAGLDKDFDGYVHNGEKENVSFLFQEYRLFSHLSALENVYVASFKNASDVDVEHSKRMLSSLGFSENDMNLIPRELSGGMKQRVAIARALLKEAPILLLDEPTKELDSGLCKILCNILKEEAERRLVLVVTHQIEDFSGTDFVKIEL